MATTTRKTVTMDELPEVLKRLNREPTPRDVFERRRRLSIAEQKIVDEMEPLPDDVKDIIRLLPSWGRRADDGG
jgi:hypothetical protein